MSPKKILSYAFGPITVAASSAVFTPLATWFFPIEDVARYSIFQITVAYCVLIALLGFDQAYVREYYESKDRNKLFKACFMPGFVMIILFAVLSIPFSKEISLLLFDFKAPWLYGLLACAVFVGYINRFFSLILRMQEHGFYFSLTQALPKILQLVFILIVCYGLANRNIYHLASINLLGFIFASALIFLLKKDDWWPAISSKLDMRLIRSLLNFSLPLAASSLIFLGIGLFNIFALRHFSSLHELAIYSVGMSFAAAAGVLQSIFTTIWTPTVFKWVADGVDLKRVQAIKNKALAAIIIVFTCSFLLSPFLVLILPPEYKNVKYIIPLCIVQPLFYMLSTITSVGLGVAKRSNAILLINISALLVVVTANILLTKRFGSVGTASANALSFLFLLTANTWFSSRAWIGGGNKLVYLTALLIFTTALVFGASDLIGYSLAYYLCISILFINIIFVRSCLLNLYKDLEIFAIKIIIDFPRK